MPVRPDVAEQLFEACAASAIENADGLVELCQWLAPRGGMHPADRDRQAWVRCYRRHRAVLAGLTTLIDVQAIRESVIAAIEAKQDASGLWDALSGLAERVDELVLEPDEVSAEQAFFVYVVWPCLWLYGECPTDLMRGARHGNLDSLEKLLRLDKLAINDRRIAARYSELVAGKSEALARRFQKAMSEGPTPSVKPARLKALISAFFLESRELYGAETGEKLKHRTAKDVRGLYDEAARQRSSAARDLDLPINDGAWAKAVKRERDAMRARESDKD